MGFSARLTHGYDAMVSMNAKSESYIVLEMWEMMILFPQGQKDILKRALTCVWED